MQHEFSRTELLLGHAALERLQNSHVLLFGVGGVGSYIAEGLVRSGLGAITIVDGDTVSTSNINRQLHALHSTVGQPKTAVMRARLLDINPNCRVTEVQHFYLPGDEADVWDTQYDYVVDAVDTVSAKLDIVQQAQQRGLRVLSCMGTGNKLDASRFQFADISQTSVCPLCRVMRRELKKRGIEHLKVLFSDEQPRKPVDISGKNDTMNWDVMRRQPPGSIAFVPPVAGLLISGEVVRDLVGDLL